MRNAEWKSLSSRFQGYTKCMDMWGVGCCLAEMVCNRPTFPGKNYLDQIHKITDILGTPTKSDSEFIVNPKVRLLSYYQTSSLKFRFPYFDLKSCSKCTISQLFVNQFCGLL